MTDVTRIEVADVYKGDALAGTLTRERDDVVFRYLPEYIADGGRAVATTLPLHSPEVRERGGAVPPFFAGLLPEGRRLTAVRAAVKTSADDELSQLLLVGGDCIGDVRVLPSGLDPTTTTIEPELSEPSQISFATMFEHELDDLGGRPVVPGVQDKLSDQMLSLPVRHRGTAMIVKLSPQGYPRLVENEAFFLDLARYAGLVVPNFSIIEDRDGTGALAVERFDRVGEGRRAQEDAVQLTGRWPASKYRMSTREIFDAVASVCAAAPVAGLRLMRLFVFSYLIGNGDLHGKNVSVFDHPAGEWSVTPAYDLLSTLPYGDRHLALPLEGRDANLQPRDFVALGSRVGLREKAVLSVIGDLRDAVDSRLPAVADIGFDDRRTALLMSEITRRVTGLRTAA